MAMDPTLKLGKDTEYPDEYAPELLDPIARADSRMPLGLGAELPFSGVDIWNAWELTWLAGNGQPRAASAEFRVPADSEFIVESKSLKLYLNSFAMSRVDSADDVAGRIRGDLARAAGADVEVAVRGAAATEGGTAAVLPGTLLDTASVECDAWQVDAGLLAADSERRISETLHTHVLRSLCPVTAQPDTGSLLIDYEGPAIDHAALLRYIVSFRRHQDFHEACVERIFLDLVQCCEPERLSVYARYQRRGGIDINPFRTNVDEAPENLRLWRQ